MIRRLRCEVFDEGRHLHRLQDFDCGEEDYQREISEWIRNSTADCVLDDLKARPDLQIWVYFLKKTVVGFGSLVLAEWELRRDGEKKSKVPVILIPNVGLSREFHGQPRDAKDKFDRYSSRILDDLTAKAKARKPKRRWLGLFVHPANKGAIRLYERHAFTRVDDIVYKHPDFKIEYPAMILDLDAIE